MDKQLLYERYQRQILLKGFGEIGQQKLLAAKVLVVGAGGLGCPILQYLAAAGVGKIGIVDDDIISLNNLHRQILFSTATIGQPKAIIAADVLSKLNPDICITAYRTRLTVENALELIDLYDIVIDGTDNFATRYLINDACVLLKKSLVYGAISQFEGQVAIFNCDLSNGLTPVNYRDLFPQPPKEGEILNCAEAGVIGILPGIIGNMMANETIKLITGIGKPLINQLLTFNMQNNQLFTWELQSKKETAFLIPSNKNEFLQMNYDWLCGNQLKIEISTIEFNSFLNKPETLIIDVREIDETPIITAFAHIRIPLTKLNSELNKIESNSIITFCQSGKRSLKAAELLIDTFGSTKKIYSLKGGIINWKPLEI